MASPGQGAYGADSDVVDYILGITFEIWEQGGVELIHQYYAEDAVIYGLDGITHGAAAVVDGTRATLESFPDRLLLAETVIWSGSRAEGYYTSHRLLSLATNKGATVYGPATGTRIRMTNIADCVIENGVIVKEWLVRDNMTLATQLGAAPAIAAQDMAERQSPELEKWIAAEAERVAAVTVPATVDKPVTPREDPEAFAWRVLNSSWRGDKAVFDTTHAPYSVLHRSPLRHYSGRDEVFDYYQNLRRIMGDVHFSVDHVASQPFGHNGINIAVRWTAAGVHVGEVMEVQPTGKPMFIMGVTHWHCIMDRIAIETTVFDDLAVLSQTMVS
ncbi:MAG: ester cyclase [Gammaproteobacteria bacterium]|nr:ester cyclase [Gammaproteobacteria bacterium]